MDRLLMNAKERKRLSLFSRVKDGQLTIKEASEHLDLSYRQACRMWHRYEARGDLGLVHRLRGQPSNNLAKSDARRERALELYRTDVALPSVVKKYGGKWATCDYRAGDVITFGMFTMHKSTVNTTNRFRLSCDVRFQPASQPIDKRWMGDAPIGHTKRGQKDNFARDQQHPE